jgi:hypothetical protein
MKNINKFSATIAVAMVSLIAGAGISSSTWAQESTGESVLIEKLDALVGQLSKLAAKSEVEDDRPVADELQIMNSGVSNPMCLDNYDSWPISNTFNPNAAWSIHGFWSWGNSNYAPHFENMTDLNGDGLVDYIYRHSYAYTYGGARVNAGESCVLLNNGNGWDVAFKCYAGWDSANSLPLFKGDCAQL